MKGFLPLAFLERSCISLNLPTICTGMLFPATFSIVFKNHFMEPTALNHFLFLFPAPFFKFLIRMWLAKMKLVPQSEQHDMRLNRNKPLNCMEISNNSKNFTPKSPQFNGVEYINHNSQYCFVKNGL